MERNIKYLMLDGIGEKVEAIEIELSSLKELIKVNGIGLENDLKRIGQNQILTRINYFLDDIKKFSSSVKEMDKFEDEIFKKIK